MEGLDAKALTEQPGGSANPIGWLVWHAARVVDHHGSELLDAEQLWVTGDWSARFGLEPDPHNTGYGHSPEEVAAVRPESGDVAVAYLEAVHERLQPCWVPRRRRSWTGSWTTGGTRR